MPQHEKLSILPFRFPPIPADVPPSVKTWIQSFEMCLESWKNAQAQTNIQSGIKSLLNPSGEGYNLGWDSNGRAGFVVGDVDNGRYIQYSGTSASFIFGDSVVVKQGDDIVYLVAGVQSGLARDGDAVTFSPAFPEGIVPKVIFGQGGLVYESSITTGDIAKEVKAIGLTNTGFTMSAKLYQVGAVTTRTLSFSGGSGVTSDEVTKTLSLQAHDDTYTFNYSVTVAGEEEEPGAPLPVYATVGLYARTSGGSFTLYRSVDIVNFTGTSQTYSKTNAITVDGLGANSVFKVQVISGDATLSCNNVTYEEDAGTTTRYSATPSGAPAIPWLAFGARSG